MTTATERLQQLLTTGLNKPNFKTSAMKLAKEGADITIQSTSGDNPTLLHILTRTNKYGANNKQIEKLLKQNPAVLEIKDKKGQTPLHSLLHNNSKVSIAMVDKLLTGKNLLLRDNADETLLHAACRSGNLSVVKHLCTKGLINKLSKTDKNTLLDTVLTSKNKKLEHWIITNMGIDQDQQHIVYLNYYKSQLYKEISYLNLYGSNLQFDQSTSKIIMNLADALKNKADNFFAVKFTESNFDTFKSDFSRLLHSKDDEMKKEPCNLYNIIMNNIAIALTGIGIFFIAGQLIHSKITVGRPLFFGQKSKTEVEEQRDTIESTMNSLPQFQKKT